MFEEAYGVMVAPLIMGVVELLKTIGLNPKYSGLVAWGIGVAIGLAYGLTEGGWNIIRCLLVGSAVGLSASGLYSGVKNAGEAGKSVEDGGDLYE